MTTSSIFKPYHPSRLLQRFDDVIEPTQQPQQQKEVKPLTAPIQFKSKLKRRTSSQTLQSSPAISTTDSAVRVGSFKEQQSALKKKGSVGTNSIQQVKKQVVSKDDGVFGLIDDEEEQPKKQTFEPPKQQELLQKVYSKDQQKEQQQQIRKEIPKRIEEEIVDEEEEIQLLDEDLDIDMPTEEMLKPINAADHLYFELEAERVESRNALLWDSFEQKQEQLSDLSKSLLNQYKTSINDRNSQIAKLVVQEQAQLTQIRKVVNEGVKQRVTAVAESVKLIDAEEQRKRALAEKAERERREKLERERKAQEERQRKLEEEQRAKEAARAAELAKAAEAEKAKQTLVISQKTAAEPIQQASVQQNPQAQQKPQATPAGVSKLAYIESEARLKKYKEASTTLNLLKTDPQFKSIMIPVRKNLNKYANQLSCSKVSVAQKASSVYQTISQYKNDIPKYHFCLVTFAARIIEMAKLQISSEQRSAFPYAILALHTCMKFPEFKDIFLGTLHTMCPYTIPRYFPKSAQMSNDEYKKLIGFEQSDDGKFEEPLAYYSRMSGIIMLYAAFVQVDVPNHPHGISYGWAWLANILNMPPIGISATVLIAFLEIAGYSMHLKYKNQFAKLLEYIEREWLPKVPAKSIAPSAPGNIRLYIAEYKRNRAPAKPDGRDLDDSTGQIGEI